MEGAGGDEAMTNVESAEFRDEEESESLQLTTIPRINSTTAIHNSEHPPRQINQRCNRGGEEDPEKRRQDNPCRRTNIRARRGSHAAGRDSAQVSRHPELQQFIGYMPQKQNEMNAVDLINITDIGGENEQLAEGTISDYTSPSARVIEICPDDSVNVTIGFMPEKQNDYQEEYLTRKGGKEGSVQRIFGSIQNLASALDLGQENEQSKQLFNFIEKHHGKENEHAFQLVLLNLPSGTPVFEVNHEHEVPPWNMESENLIENGLRVASKIMKKSGWVVCIHTWDKTRQVEDAASTARLVFVRTLTLICNLPIYCQLRWPSEQVQVHSLFISIFHGRSKKRIHKEKADREKRYAVRRQLFSQDVIIEEMRKEDWTSEPYRGGAQRSSTLWESLIVAFTKRGDLVADLTASTGTCDFVKLASQLGRHAIALGLPLEESQEDWEDCD